MTRTVLGLDDAGVFHLVREGGAITLERAGSDRTSRAEEAIARALRLRIDDAERVLDAATGRATIPEEAAVDVDLILEDGARLRLGRLGGEGDATSAYALCPFELRYAADHGRIHPVPTHARRAPSWRPRTDLHTHFAACVAGDDLVTIGCDAGIRYPTALLAEAGVRIDARDGAVPLAELPAGARARLARELSVPPDRRITFVDMERIYRLRGPITKAEAAFVPILRRAAIDYAAMGVSYVELSLGSLVSARVLRAIHAVAPAVEDETGVTLRFLLALGRHDDPEWDLDLLRRASQLEGSVYVAGIDVMGHETNSTRAFAPVLRAFAEWATRRRPGFVVRVHAGESPSHPENVRVAVEELRGHAVEARIGHGLYGVDDATLEAIVETGTIVELNLDSNVALNHLQSGRDLPLRRYVDRGARVVLGTDGYGIYGATSATSARAALVVGLRDEQLAGPLRDAEEQVIARAAERDRAAVGARATFVVPDELAPLHFTEEVTRRKEAARRAREEALEARLADVGLPRVSRADVRAIVGDRILVAVSGAWRHSWAAMTGEARARVGAELAAFVDALDPTRMALVTGGTRYGVEGLVGPRAVARGMVVLAALVAETEPDALAPGLATHAVVVAETLYEKGAQLYELVRDLGGACLFAGGGQIVADEILAAKNLGVPYVALAGVGASGAHARERPAAAVARGEEAAFFVTARGGPHRPAPHWFVGPNPTVDAVVFRRRAGRDEVLLVRRDPNAPAFPGAWALPGGFVATRASRGARWEPGLETEEEACVRELREEASLEVSARDLVRVGVFEGGGRDPRDGERSWSRSTAFAVLLEGDAADAAVAANDDAADARWFGVDELTQPLGFDHEVILAAGWRRVRGG